MNKDMVYGILIGVGGTWAFHRFLKPMRSNKPAS